MSRNKLASFQIWFSLLTLDIQVLELYGSLTLFVPLQSSRKKKGKRKTTHTKSVICANQNFSTLPFVLILNVRVFFFYYTSHVVSLSPCRQLNIRDRVSVFSLFFLTARV